MRCWVYADVVAVAVVVAVETIRCRTNRCWGVC